MIPGTIVTGEDWAVENYELKPELVERIKRTNPFYNKNDEYTNYALRGVAVNDLNIRLGKLLNGFVLKFVVDVEGDRIAIYKNQSTNIHTIDNTYYCCKNPPDNANKDVYCFDFSDLANGNILYNRSDNISFDLFKRAMRNNWVTFDTIGTYYKIR